MFVPEPWQKELDGSADVTVEMRRIWTTDFDSIQFDATAQAFDRQRLAHR